MLAKDIMVREVVTLGPDDTIAHATTKFAEHNISGCPVCDEESVIVGMLSEADILSHMKTQYKSLKMRYPPEVMFGISFEEEKKDREIAQAFEEIGALKVRDLMSRDIFFVTANDSVQRIVRLMVRNKINRVPVVENGKLVGIVTRGDVIDGIYKN